MEEALNRQKILLQHLAPSSSPESTLSLEEIRQKRATERLSKAASGPDLTKVPVPQDVVGVKKSENGNRPSVGPVYRSVFAKNGFPPPVPGMDSCWDVFRLAVEKYPNNRMLGHREITNRKAGKYVWQTYKQVYDTALKVGMLSGVVVLSRVCGDLGRKRMPDSRHQISSIYSNKEMHFHHQMEQMDDVEKDGMSEEGEPFEDTGIDQYEDVHHHPYGADAVGDGVLTGPIYAPQPVGVNYQNGINPNQLTLSFHGQVLVFDNVSTQKVQSVILLLGGSEVTGGGDNMGTIPQHHRSAGDMYGRPIQPQRGAALSRFREKKDRCFDKKIRYSVRK